MKGDGRRRRGVVTFLWLRFSLLRLCWYFVPRGGSRDSAAHIAFCDLRPALLPWLTVATAYYELSCACVDTWTHGGTRASAQDVGGGMREILGCRCSA